MRKLDYQEFTVSSAAKTLVGGGFDADDISTAKEVWISILDNDAHLRIDGTPATTDSMFLAKSNTYVFGQEYRSIFAFMSLIADTGTTKVAAALYG